MSDSEKPASRNLCAIASEAAVTLPTESVELISTSCLKMSCDNLRVASSISGCDAEREVKEHKKIEEKRMNRFLRPNRLSRDDGSALFPVWNTSYCKGFN